MSQTTIIQTALQTDAGRIDLVMAGGVSLLDFVRISASDTADQADTTGINRYAIGVVTKLNYPTTGRGLLVTHGLVDGFSGLSPNTRYILSRAPGQILDVDDTGNPDYPQIGEFLQFVGYGVTPTKLFVNVSPVLLGI